jgi:hypothetical protein
VTAALRLAIPAQSPGTQQPRRFAQSVRHRSNPCLQSTEFSQIIAFSAVRQEQDKPPDAGQPNRSADARETQWKKIHAQAADRRIDLARACAMTDAAAEYTDELLHFTVV